MASDHLLIGISMKYYLLMGIGYLGGVFIYVQKIPERWLPGKFDFIVIKTKLLKKHC